MRALKALVIIMGVLLVAGTLTLVTLIILRAAHPPEQAEAPPPAAEAAASVIDLPKGSAILSVQGTADRIVIELSRPDGGRSLLLVDPRSGRRTGAIELRPAP